MESEVYFSEGTGKKCDLDSSPAGAPLYLDIQVSSGVPMGEANASIRKGAVNLFKLLLKDLAETPEFLFI